jgi:hypothetical protein
MKKSRFYLIALSRDKICYFENIWAKCLQFLNRTLLSISSKKKADLNKQFPIFIVTKQEAS